MRNLILIILLLSSLFTLNAEPKLLVDVIHGVDYYTNGSGDQPINLQLEGYEIFEMTNDDIVLDEILYDEFVSDVSSISYDIALPDQSILESVKSLYVFLSPGTDHYSYGSLCTIQNPEGDIVAEMFKGLLHCDEVSGSGWSVNLTLSQFATYSVTIGYGNPIFATEGNPGIVDLNDYDAGLRILDETYFALEGDCDYYSSYEASAFQQAFDNGFGFLNAYNFQDGLFLKPFVHFETEKDLSIDFEVAFPGLKTLAVPEAKVDIGKMKWNDFPAKANEFNELVYEASFQSKLNFIHFEVSESQLSLENQVPHDLDNIFVFKYMDVNRYRLFETEVLEASETQSLNSYKELTTDEMIEYIKTNFMATALESGLTKAEAHHFVNEFIWIQTLLRRARNFPDDYFGFYHFNGELYDKLAPYNCSPAPSIVQRNAWVMLSNIVNRPKQPVVKFPEQLERAELVEEDFLLREYGVADMFYSRSIPDREAVFNVQLGEFMSVEEFDYMGFLRIFDNDLGNTLSSFTETEFYIENGQYGLYVDNSLENSFGYFNDLAQPTAVLSYSGENGKIISFGTAAFFGTHFGSEQFITNCANYVTGNPIVEVGTGQNEVPELNEVNLQIHPNPFNPSTTISFSLNTESTENTELEIYNVKGQKIKSFECHPEPAEGRQKQSIHSITWNGTDNRNNPVASGIYLINLKVDDKILTSKKCVLLK